ncbi:uncharacterized protein LOC132700020 [Cylas formicarius]|uniref:uncharacterized protein LOC132700020 n=1 Tax=Cylas formicarius TaxID=197179 RepID=UPI002958678D|nr:uncharacterized protein LOC132700020 [Cylas formicarius]
MSSGMKFLVVVAVSVMLVQIIKSTERICLDYCLDDWRGECRRSDPTTYSQHHGQFCFYVYVENSTIVPSSKQRKINRFFEEALHILVESEEPARHHQNHSRKRRTRLI